MKYLNFIFITMIAFLACKSEGTTENDALSATPTKETVSKETVDKTVQTIKEGDPITIQDDVKEKILVGKWAVTAWGSEELRNTLGENYDLRKEEEERKVYEFKENGQLAVLKEGEVLEEGSYGMATSGKDMKLSIGKERIMATLNFSSADAFALTWTDRSNASITLSLKAQR